jgi:two-component system, NarL family, sensor histidine kinase DevS
MRLQWNREQDEISLEIRDNGRGFDPDDSARRIGHGLSNMPTRATDLGGQFIVVSAPGEGLTLVLPMSHEKSAFAEWA